MTRLLHELRVAHSDRARLGRDRVRATKSNHDLIKRLVASPGNAAQIGHLEKLDFESRALIGLRPSDVRGVAAESLGAP